MDCSGSTPNYPKLQKTRKTCQLGKCHLILPQPSGPNSCLHHNQSRRTNGILAKISRMNPFEQYSRRVLFLPHLINRITVKLIRCRQHSYLRKSRLMIIHLYQATGIGSHSQPINLPRSRCSDQNLAADQLQELLPHDMDASFYLKKLGKLRTML